MRSLSSGAMNEVQGGRWYHAFICGFSIVGLLAVVASPDPVSKFAIGGLITGVVGGCGAMFAE